MKNNLKYLEKFLKKLTEAGLKVNTEKLFYKQTETMYLGLWVINQGVRPLLSKIDAIKKTEAPTKVHDVHRFVGLVN